MKPIVNALEEAKKAVTNIVLFNSIIDVLVMFLLLMLGCVLISVNLLYAIIPTIVYAIIHIIGNLKETTLAKIEEKTPSLREQLITVADNLDDKNEIVKSLHDEVLKKMKEIHTSSFVNFGKLTREIAVMAIASFIIIGTAAFNVHFLDLNQAVKDINKLRGGYEIDENLLEFEESQNLSEILGDESIAELGKQELDLQINPTMSEVEVGSVRDVQDRTFKEKAPEEIVASTDASYQEDIPREYQRVVKTYFKEITKS